MFDVNYVGVRLEFRLEFEHEYNVIFCFQVRERMGCRSRAANHFYRSLARLLLL